MKFYVDEHVNMAIATGLVFKGYDVLTVQEAGRRGLPDLQQLEFARENGRVVITFDRDFLVLDSLGHVHKGIIFIRSKRKTIGEIIRDIERIMADLSDIEMENHIEFV